MLTVSRCEELVDKALRSKKREDFQRAVSPMLDFYEILSFGIGRSSTHWRARIIEYARYDLLEEIDYPPPELVRRPGRLNDVGEPYFYVASTAETAVQEVLPNEGQLVQVAGFRIASGKILRLISLGEYQHVYKRGYTAFNGTDPENTIGKIVSKMSLDERQVHLLIDNFLAHVLSDKNARSMEYLHSRALRDMLFKKVDADGITFPSVRDLGGVNFAVKPEPSDDLYHNVCCMVVAIGRKPRFAPLEMQLRAVAMGLTDDRKRFVWSNEEAPTDIVMYNMTKEEYEQAVRDA
jgi:hypothetical protein